MGVDVKLSHILLFSAGVALLTTLSLSTKEKIKVPPGPKPLPLIGNLLDFPQSKRWETFTRWKQQYGNIIYLKILGTSIIVLNSKEVCTDLLDKRSNKYSGRPRSVVVNEYMGFDYNLGLMDYSPRWRTYRQLFQQYFHQHTAPTFRPTQEHVLHQFLKRLLVEPEGFISHIRLLFGEAILEFVYDIKVEDGNNIFIKAVEKGFNAIIEVAIPGRFLVDFFPAMRYLPSWFPGGTFKKFAARRRQAVLDMKELPFNYVKERMEAGTAGPSVLSSMLDHHSSELGKRENDGESPVEVAKGCAAIAYFSGADTTFATVQAFFMAIANHQGVQRAAHNEIDTLLGTCPNRLPSHEDEAQLPFIVAITKELLRWHNVTPLGVPHVLKEDDVYDGYLIRKGTFLFGNIWGIMHDPEVYPDPHNFNPWRWLIDTPNGPELNSAVPEPLAAFGFGRRLCPGRHFAMESLFITVASVLTCFEVKPLDANGLHTDHIEEVFTDGLISYPAPYKVSITPRSAHLVQLIKDMTL